jgi:hypothetical protein
MRKLFPVFLLATAAFGAEWTGYISDSSCGKANANDTAASRECAKNCVKNGARPVFVVGGKVFQISDPKSVMNFLGEKVVIDGALKGETVSVAKIKKA